jgi:hypothetical protein
MDNDLWGLCTVTTKGRTLDNKAVPKLYQAYTACSDEHCNTVFRRDVTRLVLTLEGAGLNTEFSGSC